MGVAHPGLPPVPPGLPRRVLRSGDQPYGDDPHFWRGGPVTWTELAEPRRVKARDRKTYAVDYEVRWFLDAVQGVSRRKALDRLHDVLLRPDGWLRSGVHWKRVMRREDASLLVRVIPADSTVCGPGSLGCFSWGFEWDRKPVAEMGVELIDDDGPWNIVTGMEVCGHGTFAMEDHYTREHQPYIGSLGTWQACAQVGFRPTRAEIAAAREWLAGTIDPARVHH